MQTLLLIGVGVTGRPHLAAARRLGVRVHVVETAERAAGLGTEAVGTTVCRGSSDELRYEAASQAVRVALPERGGRVQRAAGAGRRARP